MAGNADDIIAKLAAQAAGSKATATATEQLDAAIKAEQAALAGLGGSVDAAKAKIAALAASEYATAEAYEFEVAALKKLEAARNATAASAAKMANARPAIAGAEAQAAASKKAADAAKVLSERQAEQSAIARDNAAAMDSSSISLSSAFQALKAAGPEGYALAMALTAITVGVTALAGALLGGMAAAVMVTEKLSMLRTVLGALAGGAAGGAAAMKIVQDLGKSLPFSTDQVGTWAKSLMSAGFAGESLKSAIQAVAAATAIMGEEGGAAALKMLKTLEEGGAAASTMMKQIQTGGRKSATLLAEMGLTMHDLAQAAGMTDAQFKSANMSAAQMQKAIEKALAKKGADPLADLALTFPVLIAKMKEGLFSLFDKLGPAVKPFMTAVKALFGEFSKGGSVINFLKPIVTAVFTTLFSWATKAVGAIRGIIAAVLASTKSGGFLAAAWSGVKMIFVALGAVWKETSAKLAPMIAMLKAVFSNAQVMHGIGVIFKVIGAAIGLVIVIIAVLVSRFVMLAATVIGAVGLIVAGVATVASDVADAASGIIDALSGLVSGAADAASNFVSGLADGIAAGAGAIMAAVTGLASGALGAFKSAMGIASPSKVMMQMGGHMASGVAEGVDDGAPKAQAATAALVDPKALKVGKAGASGAGKSVTFDGCTFGDVSETTIRGWVLKALDEDGFAGPMVTT